MDETVYSVGKVAKHCRVNRLTVLNWIKAGKLKAYSLPSGYHRVEARDLLDFLQEHDMPVPDELRRENPVRVLVVDDDEVVVSTILEYFGRSPDFVLETASNGIEACIKVGAFRPDIVLLDLRMPWMNGVDFCEELRKHTETQNTRILVITGYPGGEEEHDIQQWNVDAVMAKPLSMDRLALEVCRLAGVSPEVLSAK